MLKNTIPQPPIDEERAAIELFNQLATWPISSQGEILDRLFQKMREHWSDRVFELESAIDFSTNELQTVKEIQEQYSSIKL